jgi:hypothetical protein
MAQVRLWCFDDDCHPCDACQLADYCGGVYGPVFVLVVSVALVVLLSFYCVVVSSYYPVWVSSF